MQLYILIAGDMFFIFKGDYIMSELLPKDGEFRSLMLFFDGRTARNLLSNIKDELPSFNSKQSKDEKRVRVVSEIQESIQRNG